MCSTEQGVTSLLNSPALQLSVEAMQSFSGDGEVVREGCGVLNALAEAGELDGGNILHIKCSRTFDSQIQHVSREHA